MKGRNTLFSLQSSRIAQYMRPSPFSSFFVPPEPPFVIWFADGVFSDTVECCLLFLFLLDLFQGFGCRLANVLVFVFEQFSEGGDRLGIGANLPQGLGGIPSN